MTLLEIISEKHIKSGGHNGSTIPYLMRRTGMDLSSIKMELNRLYETNSISVKPGVNGNLIFKKINI